MTETRTESLVLDGENDFDHALLEEFYAFTYEDAVLVGPSGSPRNSPKRPSSPAQSPAKQDQLHSTPGPPVSQVTGEEPLLSREILDAMVPPKAWRDDSGKWQRVARLTPSTRTDVLRFERLFVQLLETHQARASAICPVREKLFLQVFEELIRQCACECPEHGLLLLRVRDELRLTIQAYQTLYHSSIAYGRQKAVQAEAGVTDLEERIDELQKEQVQLRDRMEQLTHRLMHVEAEALEDQQTRDRHHRQRLQFLHHQQSELTTFYTELTGETTWK